jgi:hypothetical protein
VSQVELLFLPSVRRAAAVALTVAALLAVATTAFAADGASATGGTTAATSQPTAKKVTTKQIQKALGIKADGVMGPKTKKAIKRFQKAHGLKADGVAGPATLQALGLGSAPQNSTLNAAAPPASNDDVAAVMAKIAQCESGGDITAVSANGRYFGKYQFSRATWRRMGGRGNPARASEAEQDRRAAALYRQEGTAPWPVCGR